MSSIGLARDIRQLESRFEEAQKNLKSRQEFLRSMPAMTRQTQREAEEVAAMAANVCRMGFNVGRGFEDHRHVMDDGAVHTYRRWACGFGLWDDERRKCPRHHRKA